MRTSLNAFPAEIVVNDLRFISNNYTDQLHGIVRIVQDEHLITQHVQSNNLS